MANLKKIVYLSEAQKDELFEEGSITSNGQTITYDPNDLYVTPDTSIENVYIGNTSIVSNNIANIPYASTDIPGVVKLSGCFNLDNSNNKLWINNASDNNIKAGTSTSSYLTPSRQHQSVFYGLAKAAGDNTQSASSNAVGIYTNDAKTAIQSMLGIPTNVSAFTNDAGYLTAHQDISGKANTADLATVATSGSYTDLLNKPDLSVYLTSVPTMTGATSSANGTSGLVPAPTTTDVNKFLAGDGTYKSGGLPMVILSYGNSTWAEFEAAYNNNVIVYCRASSNSNPATGSQTRMAFMAYVNNAATPTEVEFQYYRSMSSHSATAMGDQVFVYKLTKSSGWSVTTRDASIKEINVATGSKLGVSWSSNKVTLSNTMTAADMPMSSSDATTVGSEISGLSGQVTNLETAVSNINVNESALTLSSLESNASRTCRKIGKILYVDFIGSSRVHAEGDTIFTLNEGFRPAANMKLYGSIAGTSVLLTINATTGEATIYLLNGATSQARLYFGGVIPIA